MDLEQRKCAVGLLEECDLENSCALLPIIGEGRLTGCTHPPYAVRCQWKRGRKTKERGTEQLCPMAVVAKDADAKRLRRK